MKMRPQPSENKKVLVIEDNQEIASVLTKRLQMKGYQVRWISSGLDAVEMLMKEGAPHAIILDLMIPGRSGLELLDTIQVQWKTAKLFVFSAYQNYESSVLHGMTEGFFLKSEGVEPLLEALEKSLE